MQDFVGEFDVPPSSQVSDRGHCARCALRDKTWKARIKYGLQAPLTVTTPVGYLGAHTWE
jgi:hypothetical protein